MFWAILATALLAVAGGAHAHTWHVPSEVSTIAAALDMAVAGDVVEIACGTYYESDLALKPGVSVRSTTGQPECTIIDAQQLGPVFVAQDLDSTVQLSGLTITGGLAGLPDHHGGGVLCEDSSLTLINCLLRDNEAFEGGGGIYARRSTVRVDSSEFRGNTSMNGLGGGVYGDLVELELLNSLLDDNTAVDGAGVYLARSSLLSDGCTFISNKGYFYGGALYLKTQSEASISHCTMVSNEAYYGSGLMVADNCNVSMESCIVAFNGIGAGVEVLDEASAFQLFRCNNLHGNFGGATAGFPSDPLGTDGNIEADPLFCNLEGGELGLEPASPCLPENNDCDTIMGAGFPGCGPTGVEDTPERLILGQNYPNPFNPQTTIVYELAQAGPVDLRVFDVSGRLVAVLRQGEDAAGRHAVTWSGTDGSGRGMPSGTYVYRLQADGRTRSRAMRLVR